MKITHIVRVTVLVAAIGFGGSSVLAQGIPPTELNALPVTVRVDSPTDGATVGRSVTFSGTATVGAGLTLAVDGLSYVDPRDRGPAEERGAATPGTADASGRFSFTVNLNGSDVLVNDQSQSQALAAGSHEFTVYELYAPNSGKSQPVTLMVSDGASTTSQASTVPTKTPSPSPTVTSAMVKGTWDASWIIGLLIATLFGGLVGYGSFRLFRHR